jgi:hypothetical protein
LTPLTAANVPNVLATLSTLICAIAAQSGK